MRPQNLLADRLRKDLIDEPTVHIGEPKVSTLEPIGQSLMIDSKQMEQGCVKVMDMDEPFGHSEAEFIGRSVDLAGLDTSASDPHGERIDMVVSAGGFSRFAHWRSTEFTSPDHQRLLKQSAPFQIEDQGRGSSIDLQTDLIERVV